MSNELAIQNQTSVIDGIDINSTKAFFQKIQQFQQMVKSQMIQDHDFGIVPGTSKPTLLKPGAEKILMLLGLASSFDILDCTRDFDNGFFQYQVRCRLISREGLVITEGLGSANTRERKYARQNGYDIDNTVLKMAKKRALIDATLLVASLSNIFTQDIEDMDLDGNKASDQQKVYTDNSGVITEKQLARMLVFSRKNPEDKNEKPDYDLVQDVLKKFGYENSKDVKKMDYPAICEEVQKRAKEKAELADIEAAAKEARNTESSEEIQNIADDIEF